MISRITALMTMMLFGCGSPSAQNLASPQITVQSHPVVFVESCAQSSLCIEYSANAASGISATCATPSTARCPINDSVGACEEDTVAGEVTVMMLTRYYTSGFTTETASAACTQNADALFAPAH